jgi:replicative DNA helicase
MKVAKKKIKPKHFIAPMQLLVFKAMLVIDKRGKDIDLVSVADILSKDVDGIAVYLVKLVDKISMEFCLKKEIKILKEVVAVFKFPGIESAPR